MLRVNGWMTLCSAVSGSVVVEDVVLGAADRLVADHLRPGARPAARDDRSVEVHHQPEPGGLLEDRVVPAVAVLRLRLHEVDLDAGNTPGAPEREPLQLLRAVEVVPHRPQVHLDAEPARVGDDLGDPGLLPPAVDEQMLPPQVGRDVDEVLLPVELRTGVEVRPPRPGSTAGPHPGRVPHERMLAGASSSTSWLSTTVAKSPTMNTRHGVTFPRATSTNGSPCWKRRVCALASMTAWEPLKRPSMSASVTSTYMSPASRSRIGKP